MKRLLKPTGSIYVHLDWHAAHYVKVEMDKIFGYENLVNEVIWSYRSGGGAKRHFGRKHDTLLFYAKLEGKHKFFADAVRVPYDAIIAKSRSDQFHKDGKVSPDVWDIARPPNHSKEWIGYPTQKPRAVLDMVIRSVTEAGDVVADFFVGGGTTAEVAQLLDRRWIACDISRVAVSLTADRVAKVVENQQLGAQKAGKPVSVPDFTVDHWGVYEISNLSKMAQDEFQEFVLAAYEARPESTGSVIHGYKGEEPIFVGSPDPDVAVRKEQVAEFANAVVKRLGSGGVGTMIAWAFTPAARRMAERIAAQEKVSLSFVKLRLVPLESPEFAAHVTSKHERYSELVTFVLPPTIRLKSQRVAARKYRFDVSESIALNSGAKIINAQWDFEYRDYFTSTTGFELQRTKKGEPVLTAEYGFPTVGEHEIAVRVQDDLGGEAILRETVSVS